LYKGPLGLELILLSDIIHLEACNKQTRVYTIDAREPFVFQEGLSSVGKYLTDNFFIAHRAHIVNLDYFEKYLNKERKILLRFGHEVPVSENCTKELLRILTPRKIKKKFPPWHRFFQMLHYVLPVSLFFEANLGSVSF
jgi:DNA-binding LytR/AlgR family response regulator